MIPNLLSTSKVILLHHSEQRKFLKQLRPHKKNIHAAIWNHKNKIIASCAADGKIHLSHAEKGYTIQTFEFEKNKEISLNSIAFSSNSAYLACGSNDHIIKVWSLHKQQVYLSLKQHIGCVNSVTWGNNDKIIASCSVVGDIYLHNSQNGAILEAMSLKNSDGFKMIKFSPSRSNQLASCTNDGNVMVWDVNTKSTIFNMHAHSSTVNSIAYSEANPVLLLSVSIDQKLNFYDILQKKLIKSTSIDQPLTSLAFHSDGYNVVLGTMYGSLLVYDLRNSMVPKQTLIGHQSSVRSIQFTHQIKQGQMLKQKGNVGSNLQRHGRQQVQNLKDKQVIERSQKKSVRQTSNIGQRLQKKMKEKQMNIDIQSKINSLKKKQKQKEEDIYKNNQYKNKTEVEFKKQKNQNLYNNFFKEKKQEKQPTYLKKQIRQHKKQEQDDLKKYIKECINQAVTKVRQEMNFSLQNLHIDLIRQLQIQQNQTILQIANLLQREHKMQQKMYELQKQNQRLKKHSL